MRVRLLGTGSADGWPNAFCHCASCLAAHRAGRWRGPTSALLDGRLLLDCRPQTLRAALRHQDALRRVSHVLLSGDHPDQGAQLALLARSRIGPGEPLTLVGPASVLARWGPAVGAAAGVSCRGVTPGDVLAVGGYTVRVHGGARDDVEWLAYDVQDAAGRRLLYTAGAGPLPEATLQAVTGAAFDLVLMDATVEGEVALLRERGAVVGASRLAAVHLSHHSPPDLIRRLARWDAQVVADGYEFVLDEPGLSSSSEQVSPRRTLVLGGARSGKSLVAERLLADFPAVTYLATGVAPDGADPDWQARVAQHRARRPAHWTTLETTDLVAALVGAKTPVLIDCLGMWLTTVLSRCGAWRDAPGWQGVADAQVDAFVEAWHAATVPVVAVSNEVGSGVVPATTSGGVFRDRLGRLNTRLSLASEQVLLVVAGRTLDLAALDGSGRLSP